jgi:cystathionine beta-lyase
LEGTYLAWIDIMCFELSSDEAYNELLNDGKVLVNSGTLYGKKSGEGYLRINLACPRETLKKGLIRIARILGQYIEEESRMGCPM